MGGEGAELSGGEQPKGRIMSNKGVGTAAESSIEF